MGFVVRGVGLLVVIAGLVIGIVSPVSALLETGTTSFLPTSPLLVTGYQTRSAGTGMNFVEVFNSSNALVRLQDWTLEDTANAQTLQFETDYEGFLEPGKHVVIARSGIVDYPTFRAANWIDGASKVTTLRLKRDGYRPLDVALSTKTADLDKPMLRTYNSSSYSTAAAPFEAQYRKLNDDGLYSAPSAASLQIVEVYPYASDCDPFDPPVLCGDYIKLHNATNAPIDLDGLMLRTDSSSSSRTSSNTFTLSGVLEPGGYLPIWQTDIGGKISLTNSGGYIWVEDAWGIEQYLNTMVRYESAGTAEQGLSYALGDNDLWSWTSTPMPTSANSITNPAIVLGECPEGKYRNPETNRCRNIEEVINSLASCDEGSERNPLTNRCRKLSSSEALLTPCKEGQVRSLETNRCRSIVSEVADLIPCNDGYERNPSTNRCRKVQSATAVKGAQFPVEPTSVAAGNTAGVWALAGVVAAGAGYGIWEWRQEIGAGMRRLFAGAFWWRK